MTQPLGSLAEKAPLKATLSSKGTAVGLQAQGAFVTWNGANSVVCNNEVKKSDEKKVDTARSVTIGVKSSVASPTAETLVFVRMKADGSWFFSNKILASDLQAEDGVTPKTAACTLLGAVYSFKLQVKTTQQETITAEYFVQI